MRKDRGNKGKTEDERRFRLRREKNEEIVRVKQHCNVENTRRVGKMIKRKKKQQYCNMTEKLGEQLGCCQDHTIFRHCKWPGGVWQTAMKKIK